MMEIFMKGFLKVRDYNLKAVQFVSRIKMSIFKPMRSHQPHNYQISLQKLLKIYDFYKKLDFLFKNIVKKYINNYPYFLYNFLT